MDFLESARLIHGNKFDYSKVRYVNSRTKVEVICPAHGSFHVTPSNHIRHRSGCPRCKSERLKSENRRPWDSVLSEFIEVHGSRYDYANSIFLDMSTKISVICRDHGQFDITPANHRRGRGCSKCASLGRGKQRRLSLAEFVTSARAVHGNAYDYSATDYVTAADPVTIVCPSHGEFSQSPNSHLSGRGCPQCALDRRYQKRALSTSDFVARAVEVHGATYDYSKVEYTNMDTSVIISCHKHGDFAKIPYEHLNGSGCNRCNSKGTSRAEDELRVYLESLGLTVTTNRRDLIPPYEIDLYVEELNLGIEYCGLFWHSERYRDQGYHLMKHKMAASCGIRLITLFEDEWVYHRIKVENTLRHLSGKSPRGCFGRKVVVREIPWSIAGAFLDKYHLLGSGHSGTIRLGAFDGETLIAVMTFGSPSDERGSTDFVEMKRYVCDGRNHPGVASKMFQHALKHYGFTRVQAFVDRRWFTGDFKTLAGFEIVGETGPSMFWVKGTKRFHRRFMTKRQLVAMPEFSGREMTKKDMLAELGYSRIFDCGKLKLMFELN